MLNRDENGVLVSADKLSDVTDALKVIENDINDALKKGDKLTEDEKNELIKTTSELQDIFNLVTPELKSSITPIELIGFLKQVMKIKNLAEKIAPEKKEND